MTTFGAAISESLGADVAAFQASAWSPLRGHEDHAEGSAFVDQPMQSSSLVNVWCAVKPIAAMAMLSLAEANCVPEDTPIRDLSETCAGAKLPDEFTLGRLHRFELPLSSIALIEARVADVGGFAVLLERELSNCGEPDGLARFSEFSAWLIVSEIIEALSGTDATAYLNFHLQDNGLDVAFGLTSSSARLARVAAYFERRGRDVVAIDYDRLPSSFVSWTPAFGGLANAAALCQWSARLITRYHEDAPACALLPSSASLRALLSVDEMGWVAGFDRTSELHQQCSALSQSTLVSRGWFGLALLVLDPARRIAASVILTDLSVHPERLPITLARAIEVSLE